MLIKLVKLGFLIFIFGGMMIYSKTKAALICICLVGLFSLDVSAQELSEPGSFNLMMLTSAIQNSEIEIDQEILKQHQEESRIQRLAFEHDMSVLEYLLKYELDSIEIKFEEALVERFRTEAEELRIQRLAFENDMSVLEYLVRHESDSFEIKFEDGLEGKDYLRKAMRH